MYKCEKCNQQFNSVSQKANHVRWHHKQITICQCQKCGRKIIGNAAFKYHKKACKGIAEKEKHSEFCDLCGYKISQNCYERHHKYCNGLGPRKFRTASGPGCGWSKGLTKHTDQRIKKMSQSLTGKQWKSKTQQSGLVRSQKIRQKILIRYTQGWLPKAGRCKKIDYESQIAGIVKLDGSWQLAVAKYFDNNKINWKRNTKRFKYIHNNKEKHYTPDFYLVDTNQYIEVKGYITQLDKTKWQQFTQKLTIWDKLVLKRLNIL